ncbi:MAG: hypothetical protein ACK4QW_13000, partial [Alphaproteobacteria bacterium]
MNRFLILGAVGLAAILVAGGLDLWINRDEPDPPPAAGVAPALPVVPAAAPPQPKAEAPAVPASTSEAIADAVPAPPAARPASSPPSPSPPPHPAPTPSSAAPSPPAPLQPAIVPNAAADRREPASPTFDIVRVNREGAAVIAGHATPDATVTVRDGAQALGTVRADRRGDWVLVPDRALEPGARQLSLEALD